VNSGSSHPHALMGGCSLPTWGLDLVESALLTWGRHGSLLLHALGGVL